MYLTFSDLKLQVNSRIEQSSICWHLNCFWVKFQCLVVLNNLKNICIKWQLYDYIFECWNWNPWQNDGSKPEYKITCVCLRWRVQRTHYLLFVIISYLGIILLLLICIIFERVSISKEYIFINFFFFFRNSLP